MRALRLVLLLAAVSTPTFADYLRIVPPAPDSDDVVVAELGGLWSDSCTPRNPEVRRVGNDIVLNLSTPSVGACLMAIMPWEQRVTIGTLPAGVYTLRVFISSNGRRTEWRMLTLGVTQANAAFSVTPNVGSIAGGTEVFIAGSFGACPFLPPCFVPQVRFGGVLASSLREVTGGIIATTPASAAGIVDIELRGRAGSVIATLPAAFTFVAAGRPEEGAYTPVLIPLIFSGPGVAGSDWFTEASAYNESAVAITPLNREAVTTCPANVSPCPAPPFAARAWDDFHHTASYPSGLILWIPTSQMSAIRFSLHARDRSRTTENAGTEIPVLRGDELLDRRIHLLNIPLRPGFRQMLRVYDLGTSSATGASSQTYVSINMYSRTGELLGSRVLALSSPDEACFATGSTCTPTRPRYGALNDFLPQVGPPGIESVRLVIESQDPSARLWAFVSVTNNTTQLFTTITPQ